ncbi:MAG TPA: type IV conjugative transfer system protein TraL [Thiohalobacter sp.]|nr:type IV conjugative transfer system protein TraL [Thiohalobacter sp.]
MKRHMPQYLHKPLQILFFEQDELVILLVSYFLANMIGGYAWLLLLLMTPAYIWAKRRYPRGFLTQLPYRLGLLCWQGYPSVYHRKFRE